MNNFEKQLKSLTNEERLLKKSEVLIAHIWNTVINGGKFSDTDLKNMEELGIDIRGYFHKKIKNGNTNSLI